MGSGVRGQSRVPRTVDPRSRRNSANLAAQDLALGGPLTFDAGGDQDIDIFTVNVTGTPTISWDESSDAFQFSKPVIISGDGAGDISHTIAGVTVTSTMELHSEGTTELGGLAIHRHTNSNNFGGHLLFFRSDGLHATASLVDDNDTIARVIGLGYDGVDYELVAEIQFLVDGTAAEDQMPGEIKFFTNAGGQTLTERMSIQADGQITLGDVIQTSGSTLTFFGGTLTAQPAAYTQTFATATRTHSNLTSATLTDNSGGTANTTIAVITNANNAGSADVAPTADAIADMAAQINALRVDLDNAKQVLNQVVDDLQGFNLLQ